MRKLRLLVAILVFPLAAAAQGPAGAGAGSGSGSSRSSRSGSGSSSETDLSSWQLAVGYQYNRINLVGSPFNTDGVNTTVTRFFGRWFGVDGQAGVGFFGNTGATSSPPNLGVHSFFLGGGPRVAYRGFSRIQPWVHFVVGLEDFRFTQTAGVLGSNKGLSGAAGAGVDFPLSPHFSVRGEGDQFETRLFSTYQRHFQIVGGFVFNF